MSYLSLKKRLLCTQGRHYRGYRQTLSDKVIADKGVMTLQGAYDDPAELSLLGKPVAQEQTRRGTFTYTVKESDYIFKHARYEIDSYYDGFFGNFYFAYEGIYYHFTLDGDLSVSWERYSFDTQAQRFYFTIEPDPAVEMSIAVAAYKAPQSGYTDFYAQYQNRITVTPYTVRAYLQGRTACFRAPDCIFSFPVPYEVEAGDECALSFVDFTAQDVIFKRGGAVVATAKAQCHQGLQDTADWLLPRGALSVTCSPSLAASAAVSGMGLTVTFSANGAERVYAYDSLFVGALGGKADTVCLGSDVNGEGFLEKEAYVGTRVFTSADTFYRYAQADREGHIGFYAPLEDESAVPGAVCVCNYLPHKSKETVYGEGCVSIASIEGRCCAVLELPAGEITDASQLSALLDRFLAQGEPFLLCYERHTPTYTKAPLAEPLKPLFGDNTMTVKGQVVTFTVRYHSKNRVLDSTGAQLIPFPYVNANGIYGPGTEYTANGITFSMQPDGKILISGQATVNADFYLIKGDGAFDLPAGTYTLGGLSGSSKTYAAIIDFVGKTSGTRKSNGVQTSKVLEFAEDMRITGIYLRIFAGFEAQDLFVGLMLNTGVTVAPYAPYSGGLGLLGGQQR